MSFQQRLADLSSLENETIRWEELENSKRKLNPKIAERRHDYSSVRPMERKNIGFIIIGFIFQSYTFHSNYMDINFCLIFFFHFHLSDK